MPHFIHAVIVKFPSTGFFNKRDIFIDLTADITGYLIRITGMAKGRIQHKKRYVEITRLNFIPFEYSSADVVAAHQHVRFGQTTDGAAVDGGAGDIGARI